MGSAVKWVFCALFDTMSIIILFHSSEYRKIPLVDSSWRCPLHGSAIFKSYSIFELPNKSPSFRLRHSANENLSNVYVPHLSILQITVLNDREFSIAKPKPNSIQEMETPGLRRESKSDLLTEKFEFLWICMDTKANKFLNHNCSAKLSKSMRSLVRTWALWQKTHVLFRDWLVLEIASTLQNARAIIL